MAVFQEPAETTEERAASEPLDLAPDEVAKLHEAEWYARVYRGDVPQLTLRAFVTGSVLGFLLSFTNLYIGLKIGWFLGVNLTAAVLSHASWTTLHRVGLVKRPLAILEQACAVSTASSAGYATGNMAIAAIPAMLLLSVTEANPRGTQLHWASFALWIFLVAALGVVIAIPMKRMMINRERLTFPSGTAAAAMLHALYQRGESARAIASAKARSLFLAASVAGVLPLLKDLRVRTVGVDPKSGRALREGLIPGESNVFDWMSALLPESWTRHWLGAGPASLHPNGRLFQLSDYQLKLDHGVALVAAGVIIGLRLTAWMIAGGLFMTLVLTPLALDAPSVLRDGRTIHAATSPGSGWKEIGLWLGAPLLVASGLVHAAAQVTGMLRRRREEAADRGQARVHRVHHDEPDVAPSRALGVEVPTRWFVWGITFAATGTILLARVLFAVPIHLGVIAVTMTAILSYVACRATGESDLTPGNALGKLVQLTFGVLAPHSTTANLQSAAITAGASIASADLLTDLKCGYLLGANPRRQFIAQAGGIFAGTLATTIGYFLLVPDATTLTGTASSPPIFPAPNAQLWKAVAEVLAHGLASLHPMARASMAWGVALGVALAAIERFVPGSFRRWVPSPIGLGLGMILPFIYPLALFGGALVGELLTSARKTWSERYLLVIAAGAIAGESVIGVVVQAINQFVLG